MEHSSSSSYRLPIVFWIIELVLERGWWKSKEFKGLGGGLLT